MISGDPSQEIFHWEQLAILSCTSKSTRKYSISRAESGYGQAQQRFSPFSFPSRRSSYNEALATLAKMSGTPAVYLRLHSSGQKSQEINTRETDRVRQTDTHAKKKNKTWLTQKAVWHLFVRLARVVSGTNTDCESTACAFPQGFGSIQTSKSRQYAALAKLPARLCFLINSEIHRDMCWYNVPLPFTRSCGNILWGFHRG